MTNEAPEKQHDKVLWKRGWFVGGLGAAALLLVGIVVGITFTDGAPSATDMTQPVSTTDPKAETTILMVETTATMPTTSRTSTITIAPSVRWDSTKSALADMIACEDTEVPCKVVWPTDDSTAEEMPSSILGYEISGATETNFFRVLGDGSTALASTFPYLVGDCATQVWTARWRSVTRHTIGGAVIPAAPDQLPDLPWNPDWGEPPEPSQAGFLAGFGCTQPAWTWVDDDPEFTVVADGVVEWQIWLAAP